MKRLSILFPAVVLAALLFSLVSVLWPLPESVSADQWKSVEAFIQEQNGSGDLVIVHPVWEDSALSHFKSNFLILGKPNTESYKLYPRVWVVLTHGAGVPGYLSDELRRDVDERLGDIRLLRYVQRDADRILYDFYSHVPDAKVEIQKGNDVRACEEFRIMRWWCPVRDWNHMGQRSALIQKKWQSCIWMHPLKDWTTRARYDDVLLGKRLVGEFAMTDEAAELKNGAPITLRILIGKREMARLTTQRAYGWQPFEIDTRKLEGTRQPITFEVTAKHDGLRHFCFRIQSRSDELGAERFNMPEAFVPLEDDKKARDRKAREERRKNREAERKQREKKEKEKEKNRKDK